jgi:5-methylcytosine-specific restriction endonuclease McrA
MATNSKKYNKKNYKKYWGSKKAVSERSERNKARRILTKEGRIKKGDGKEVDHKKPISKGGTNSKKNLAVTTRKANRKRGAAIANANKKKKTSTTTKRRTSTKKKK